MFSPIRIPWRTRLRNDWETPPGAPKNGPCEPQSPFCAAREEV